MYSLFFAQYLIVNGSLGTKKIMYKTFMYMIDLHCKKKSLF